MAPLTWQKPRRKPRQKLNLSTGPRQQLAAFLASSLVVLGEDEDLVCLFEDFKTALQEFETNTGYRHAQLTNDYFRQVFADNGIRIVRDRREHRGRPRDAEWVVGASLAGEGGSA